MKETIGIAIIGILMTLATMIAVGAKMFVPKQVKDKIWRNSFCAGSFVAFLYFLINGQIF